LRVFLASDTALNIAIARWPLHARLQLLGRPPEGAARCQRTPAPQRDSPEPETTMRLPPQDRSNPVPLIGLESLGAPRSRLPPSHFGLQPFHGQLAFADLLAANHHQTSGQHRLRVRHRFAAAPGSCRCWPEATLANRLSLAERSHPKSKRRDVIHHSTTNEFDIEGSSLSARLVRNRTDLRRKKLST
jgi:hypothetical protein